MTQLNVSIDDALAVAADRLASIKEVSRPELVRLLLREAIAAAEDGRILFSEPAKPVDLTALGELTRHMLGQSTELERLLRDHDRRSAKLERTHQAGEDANRLAYENLVKQLRVHLGEGYKPFHDLVEQLKAEGASQSERLHTAIVEQPRLAEINTRLDSMDEAIRKGEPPVHNHWVGYGFSWKGWSLVGLAGFSASTLLLLLMAKVLPDEWVANPLTLYAYGSNATAICSIYKNATRKILCPIVSDQPVPGTPQEAKP